MAAGFIDLLSLTGLAPSVAGSFTKSASSSVNFGQAADENLETTQLVLSNVALTQELIRVEERSVAHLVSFSTLLSRQALASGSNVIVFAQAVNRTYPESVTSSILFSQTVIQEASKQVTTVINLTQTVAPNLDITRIINDVVSFTQSVYGTNNVLDKCAVFGTLGIRDGIRLTFPYVTPTTTLDLKNPEFGNKQNIVLRKKAKRTETGHLLLIASVTWPRIETILFDFANLPFAKRIEFQTFMLLSAGKEIGLLDHENRQWRGLINSEITDVRQDGPGCKHATSFSFRGVLA